MKERAGDMPAPAAGVSERLALGVGEGEEAFIVSRRDQRRVVELMPANRAPGLPERAVGEKPRLAVAETQLAVCEARRVPEQARHGMAHPLGVFEAFAQHHVAAAFAMHRTLGA